MNTVLNVGIMPREQFQQRLLDIAAGRYGIVELCKQNRSVRPVVKATGFTIQYAI